MKLKIFVLTMLAMLALPELYVQAEENAPVPYSVEAVLPDNQISNEVTYFDLMAEPGKTQELTVTVYNSSDKEIKLEMSPNFAATNSNGVIIYDGSVEEKHESMKYPFNEIAKVKESKFKIPAHSQYDAKLTVKYPDETFDGQILGGIFFNEVSEKTEEEGVSIQNEYAYAVAVKLTSSDGDSEMEPEILLESVEGGLADYRTAINTVMSNPTPTLINDLTITANIYKKDEPDPIYTRTTEDFDIAPNSVFNFPVSLDNHPLEPGEYTLKGNAVNDEHEFSFEKKFTITEEVADETNDSAVEIEKENNTLIIMLISIGVLILAALAVIIILLFRNRKKQFD